jgi:hypothetical protein
MSATVNIPSRLAASEAAGEWNTYLFNHASWGAIIAGVVAALVVQLLLNLLGLGIGAASLSATPATSSLDTGSISMAAGLWWIVSGIIGTFCGGIVAGRLCGAAKASTARWHGFVAWCVTTLVIVYLLASALGNIVGGTLSVLGGTLGGIGRTAASAVSGLGQAEGGNPLEAQVRSLINPNDTQVVQNDILTYLQAMVSGNQQAADAARDRAVNGLARIANVSPDEARNRLNQAAQQTRQTLERARQQALQGAEAARAGASRVGILAFIVLVIGAFAGWLGGGVGTPRREIVVPGIRPL